MKTRKEILRYIVDCQLGFVLTYAMLAPVAMYIWKMNITQFIYWTRDSFIFNQFFGYILSKTFDVIHKKLGWK